MTDLSSLSISAPRAQMNARIAAAASAGTIRSADQAALSTALDSIGTSLSSGAGVSGTGGASVKDRVDTLIQQQVSTGTLTSDQAGELRSFLAQGAPPAGQASPPPGGADGGVSGVGGASGAGSAHRAHGGHGHRAAFTDDDTATTAADSDDTGATNSFSTSLDDELDQVNQLLDKVRQSLASSFTYGATASGGGASSGLILNAAA